VKRLAWLLGPPLLAVLAYANALGNPFVYDDFRMVVDNPSLRAPVSLRTLLLHQLFRPIVNLSYAADHALFGLEPFGYHLTSLLLHCVNVVLLARLVARVPAQTAGREGPPGSGPGVAAFAAALFAVHPLATESVGYVSGRAELLCASFFLLAFLSFQRAFSAAPAQRRGFALAGGLVAFALALASKEVAAMLPVALVLYDLLLLPPADPERRSRWLRLHLPLLAAVAGAAFVRLAVYRALEARSPAPELAPHLLTQFRVVWRYLALFFVPVGQSVVHEVPRLRSLGDPGTLTAALAGAALLAVALLAWRARRRQPLAAFGALWYLALLVPSSGMPMPEVAAEHRTYLASAGLCIAAASLLAQAPRALGAPSAAARPLARAGAAAILAALALLTVARNRVWSDPVRLFEDAVRHAPGLFASNYQLAEALRERGECAAAVPYYERAVALGPGFLDAGNNLGVCLAETGRYKEARRAFDAVLARDPAYPRALNNLRTLSELENARRRP
jgi:tetratricopeptide (TPR) repeat protein